MGEEEQLLARRKKTENRTVAIHFLNFQKIHEDQKRHHMSCIIIVNHIKINSFLFSASASGLSMRFGAINQFQTSGFEQRTAAFLYNHPGRYCKCN